MATQKRSIVHRFRVPIFVLCAIGVLTGIIIGLLWTNRVVASSLVQSRTGTRTSNQANPTIVSTTLSPAAVAGHLLVAVVGANGSATITGPTNWSTAINQSGTPSQAIFYTVALGGETAISASVNASPGSLGIHVYEYAGTEVMLAGTGSATGSSDTPTSGTVTTTDTNELILAAFTNDANKRHTNSTWANAGEGFTELVDFGTTGSGRAAGYAGGDNLVNTAGPHGVTTSISASANWRGQIVAFRTQTSVTNVTSSLADGTYGTTQAVPIQVTFSRTVTVNTSGGTPHLTLNNGAHPDYASGSGGTTLTFTYTARAGEDIADLDYAATDALTLNGGTILDNASNAALLTLAAPGAAGSLGANKNIVIHTDSPTFAAQYFSDSALTSSLGDNPQLKTGTYYLRVIASEALSAAPAISILAEGTANDITDATATPVSGTTYRLERTIAPDAAAIGAELEEIHIAGSDLAGNQTTNAHPSNDFTAAAYTDTVVPSIPTITAISSDNYIHAGEKSAIVLTGTAEADSLVSATLSDGTNTKSVTQQLSGGATLFSISIDGTTATPAALADGTITPSVTATDAAGNISTARTTPTATQESTAPTLSTVTIASNNADVTKAKRGDTVTLTFSADESLRTPTVSLNGAPIVVSGSGTNWTASRIVSASDTEGPETFSIAFTDLAGNDGISVTTTTNGSSVTLDVTPPVITEGTAIASPTNDATPEYMFTADENGTITYGGSCSSATTNAVAGNNTITLTSLSDGTYTNCTIHITNAYGSNSGTLNISQFTIDTVSPTITNVTVQNANGTYGTGSIIEVYITATEPIFATGIPTLALNASDSAVATYHIGSGADSAIFLYTVQDGDSSLDLDYIDTSALSLNGGTATDAAGNALNGTLPIPGAPGSIGANKAIVIDTAVPDTSTPAVLYVHSLTTNGTYGIGANIVVHAHFDEAVIVTGTPQMLLNISGGKLISYASGSGTDILSFTLTAQSGDDTADLDYSSTDSLTLNGGTIQDSSGNAATLTLASPGASGSLGDQSDIVIHTIPPVISEITPIGEYTADQTPVYTFTANETGTITYGGDCTSPTIHAIVGTNTIEFNRLTEGTHNNCTIIVTDVANNASNTLAIAAFEISLGLPQILSVSPASGGTNQYRSYPVAITFTEPMDPTTFSIADDDTNAYDDPTWSNGNRTVTITHTAWSGLTLVTISVDGADANGDALGGQKSWSFTTEAAPASATGDNPGMPYSLSTTCHFTPWSQIGWEQGADILIGWSARGTSIATTRLSYSLDNRKTWTTITNIAFPNTLFSWSVPLLARVGEFVSLKLECQSSDGATQSIAETAFLVSAGSTTEPAIPPSSMFSPENERMSSQTISEEKSLVEQPFTNACAGASRIKTKTGPTVYYCGTDGKRYPFPDAGTYFSWYKTYDGIHIVSDAAIEEVSIGSSVTYRPGTRLLKLRGNNKVFAVSKGGTLHWITSERAAAQIYGPYWNTKIDDLSNETFGNYTIGEPIE
ncbi:MAG: Ig-like domain-containing protein [Patescibacteria group bacterium]